VLHGPYVESGYSVPQSFSDAPTGTYTVTYSSGGPPSSVFDGVSPSSQVLPASGIIRFTMLFTFQRLPEAPYGCGEKAMYL
jgi:hypothetical protein